MTGERKVAIVMYQNGVVSILIPKRRGRGYVRTPYYHSLDRGIEAIESIADYDKCGLDGSLDIEGVGYLFGEEVDEFLAEIMPDICAYYGCDWLHDPSAFWRLHPVAPQA